ncbi:MAG: hypothetical protein QM723_00795 [Myxococcaceae bacterium]
MRTLILSLSCFVLVAGCSSPEPSGLAVTPDGTGAMVKFDMYARPFPDVPLPNDIATRYDPGSPTKRRVNASQVATTDWEVVTRGEIDKLDGWSTYGALTVAFDKPLDPNSLYSRHVGDDYDFSNDAVYLIDVTEDSPDFCQAIPLDMGEGNFPLTLEKQVYYPNDIHNTAQQMIFEEFEEDTNHNGKLDLGEDLDMDGELDHPNYRYPGDNKFDVMTYYERQTNTLIMKPVMPMREATTYAAVITRRVLDEDGRPVRSPFTFVNHASQTQQLKPLMKCLPKYDLASSDLAFVWSFTTQSISKHYVAVRDGIYGLGPMAWLKDQYPATITHLYTLNNNQGTVNVNIVPGDTFRAAAKDVLGSMNGGTITPAYQQVLDSMKFIDYHVVFSFNSPQLFPRDASDGTRLPLYKQTWDVDPVTGAAPAARAEEITVWMTVPKNRNGHPAPAVILGHGYTGNKLDPLIYGGFMARQGIAAIGVECTSHGIGLAESDKQLARALFQNYHLEGFFDAAVNHQRALDWDNDGIVDSGADYWTSFIFHTRDMVRQSVVDYMQLIKLMRGFDGAQRWQFDVNKDGVKDLAGDFDGDGIVDVGGSAPINMTGGSLGGILSTILAGAEPELEAAVPVSGGAGLIDIGVRSIQGGVPDAVNLRMMGPLLISCPQTGGCDVDPSTQPDGAMMDLWEFLPDCNDTGKVKLAAIPQQLNAGDTVVVTNVRTGEYRCGRVGDKQRLRTAVSSDEGDALTVDIYPGPLPAKTPEGCSVPESSKPAFSLTTLGYDVSFQAPLDSSGNRQVNHKKGDPIEAYGAGFGLRRNHPEMRKFMTLAQMAIDPGDPANFAPNFERRLLTYGTGEQVRTNVVIINSMGDMNVPIATGTAMARAAGFIELYEKDPRWNKTVNRLLIDTGTIEGVERTGRWQNSKGEDVHMDIENMASIVGADDQFDVPRLNPPLRDVGPSQRIGGTSGVLFPMAKATGRHGFDPPDPSAPFDLGSLLTYGVGRFIATHGAEFPLDACQVSASCSWLPPIPPGP